MAYNFRNIEQIFTKFGINLHSEHRARVYFYQLWKIVALAILLSAPCYAIAMGQITSLL